MTLGVTGVVWLPRMATVNSTSLLAGAGAAPLSTASAAWSSVAAAYSDTSVTIARVMAVLAAGWEGEAANAALARLGGFSGWTQSASAKAAQISALAAGESAAYIAAVLVMPNPAEIFSVKAAKATAYSSGGALNGSAEALEVADRALDVRAALVMEAYEAATTPMAIDISFDRPPEIVNDGSGSSRSAGKISDADSYEESSIFGFGTRTSPAQAAAAAVGAALQHPGVATAAGQFAGTAGSVAGSSVTTVASAATNIGTAAASTLMNSGGGGQNASPTPFRADPASAGAVSTRAVSAGASGAAGTAVGSGGFGGMAGGSGKLGGPGAGSSGYAFGSGGERVGGTAAVVGSDGGAAARGAHGGVPVGGSQAGQVGQDEDEHETPGYLKQFEHFADGRTVAPSVIGADPTWNDR